MAPDGIMACRFTAQSWTITSNVACNIVLSQPWVYANQRQRKDAGLLPFRSVFALCKVDLKSPDFYIAFFFSLILESNFAIVIG